MVRFKTKEVTTRREPFNDRSICDVVPEHEANRGKAKRPPFDGVDEPEDCHPDESTKSTSW